jgi:hypothetical protein
MRTHRFLLLAATLLLIPTLASAAPAAQAQPAAPAPAVASAAVPSLPAFLASLGNPSTAPTAPLELAANACGSNFCTQSQRNACTQQCLQHHHGTFVGLQCCSDCTTICNCGSVPIGC